MELLESLDELYEILRGFIFFKEKQMCLMKIHQVATPNFYKDILRKLLTELE